MTFHARPRFTNDLDVWVEPTSANGDRVFAALAGFGAPLAAHGVRAQDFATPGTLYQIGLPFAFQSLAGDSFRLFLSNASLLTVTP